jgi:hypothetical protein
VAERRDAKENHAKKIISISTTIERRERPSERHYISNEGPSQQDIYHGNRDRVRVASLGRDQSRKQIKANTAEKEQKEREEDKANNWVAIGLQKDHSGIPLLTCPPAHP